MKRTPLRMILLAGAMLGLTVHYVAGREDDLKRITLANLKTELLRKMVAAHAGSFAKDRAASAKTLNDTLGGSAGVAGKLTYGFKDGKPAIEIESLAKDIDPAGRDAALAAVKELLVHSLNKVSDTGFGEGDKKLVLAKDDAKALAGAARIRWAAAPPPVDPGKALGERLDKLVKELEALKKLEARVGKVEKDAPGIGKKLDDLTAEIKKVAEVAKKLDALPAQIKALEGKAKMADDRAVKQEKALTDSTTTVEKQGKEIAALKKLNDDNTAALKKQADELAVALKKQADVNVVLKKGSDDNTAALKKQATELATALEKHGKEMAALTKKVGDDSAAALKKQSDEQAVALKKQTEANVVAMKKQSDELMAVAEKLKKASDQATLGTSRLKAIEEQQAKDLAEAKKVAEKLAKIEAILFPPPPPVIHCEIVEQGCCMMTHSWRRGCFGRSIPTMTMTWVPCPTPCPIETKILPPTQAPIHHVPATPAP